MSELKIGDHVRVQYEAVVINPKDFDGDVELRVEGGKYNRWCDASDVTLIEPKYDVGAYYISDLGYVYERVSYAGRPGESWRSARTGELVPDDIPVRPLRKLVPEGEK